MNLQLLLVVFKLIHDQLSSEIENVRNGLPDSYGHEEGSGAFLDPHVTVYPILNGLYSILTTLDNVTVLIESIVKEESQK